MASPREVVVLGGGISGLVTAWSIVRASALRSFRGSGQPCPRITIIESNAQVGGCIKTHHGPGGVVMEHGPRGMRPSGPAGRATLNLASSVGLAHKVVLAGQDHPGAKNRFIYANNRLQKLPSSFSEVARNVIRRDPMTLALVKAIIIEPFRSKAKSDVSDETVYDFGVRRLGANVAGRLLDPLCVGIFGGDCRTLSLQSCFPSLKNMERDFGSLVKGALRQKAPQLPDPEPGTEWLLNRVKGARIWSLEHGLADLPLAVRDWLEATGNVDIRCGERVTLIDKPNEDGRVRVHLNGREVLECDHVVSALPAHTLAQLVHNVDPKLAHTAASIPFNGIVVANYLFRGRLLDVEGFGYLVPTTEPEGGVLGVVFDSCAFPQQDDVAFLDADVGAVTRLTVMTGGPKFNDLYGTHSVNEATVHNISLAALQKHLGITADPVHSSVMPWVDTMPQYTVGHAGRVAVIEKALMREWNHRLSVVGNSYYGVGVNDCVLAGTNLGSRLVEEDRV
eukprot:m.18538 g.18538  ORF g.18538 m.18538 type:complete len:507 (+) comp3603_c0_seq2:203-1723(+)